MSVSTLSDRFHTVIIRGDLPKVQAQYSTNKSMDISTEGHWINALIDYFSDGDRWKSRIEPSRFKLRHTISNGPHTSLADRHGLFSAFLNAYNSHEDIVLSPDDLWLMVTIYFAKYINGNAEKLRHVFVDHEGEIELTIVQTQAKPDWNEFLESMRNKIADNVKNDIVTLLAANYSTTSRVESLLFYATIMNTFRKYFKYTLRWTLCGIRKVHFLGTLDDWLLLRRKTEQLQSFTTPQDDFYTYIDGVLPVLDQLISTYQGKVDNTFWDKIFDIEHAGPESGSWTKITGWFLRLCYGIHMKEECKMDEVALHPIVTPVEFQDEYANEKRTCYIVGGFHGIESRDEWHKPVMSLAIFDDLSTITELESSSTNELLS
ncbi:unnamed protein product [Rotaria magnacalcarata]|uniref:Uncharacterized protein n=2 Tax=Rotaria magnacalcarata TaxID=392030 RepID=A0A816DIX0_9BILA|nr:unnamed protein product [Rotaria magnacalcarata]